MNHGSPLEEKKITSHFLKITSHLGHTFKGAYQTPSESIDITCVSNITL